MLLAPRCSSRYSPRVQRLRLLASSALVALTTLAPLMAMQACKSPSASVDGGDLLGVFEHDASVADASAKDASVRKGKHDKVDSGTPDASSSSSLDASVRPPPSEGNCVAPKGQQNREIRRTLGRPPCRGAQVVEWRDSNGSPRYACIFTPPGVETRAPLPLLIFFHGPADSPTAIDKKTGLRKQAASFNLTGDPAHTGFIILAPQGRAIKLGRHGSIFDTEYTGADNVDVTAVDHFVAQLENKGLVDKRRIYTIGASYGGHMAATYAMMRADRIAAFATYAADAPSADWSCPGPPPPAMLTYRACDGFISCEAVERWIRARDAEHAETGSLRLDEAGREEPNCTPRNKCTPKKAEINHQRWPKNREADILRFFSRHALGLSAPAGGPR